MGRAQGCGQCFKRPPRSGMPLCHPMGNGSRTCQMNPAAPRSTSSLSPDRARDTKSPLKGVCFRAGRLTGTGCTTASLRPLVLSRQPCLCPPVPVRPISSLTFRPVPRSRRLVRASCSRIPTGSTPITQPIAGYDVTPDGRFLMVEVKRGAGVIPPPTGRSSTNRELAEQLRVRVPAR